MLYEQFSKMANIYFLFIAFLQTIKEISTSGGKPVILLPLLIVVTINGIKDLFEDLKRKASDKEENNRKCKILNKETGSFVENTWENLKLGDIVKVDEDEYFPADLILLDSSEANGLCYIETKNLDGETSLKYKHANSELSKLFEGSDDKAKILSEISCSLICKPPNEHIYEFDGKLEMQGNKNEIFIEKESFLLRGCSLRQTTYIYGFVVYVGHNTKIMKNSPKPRRKSSRIESIMNYQILIVFIVQLCLSGLASLANLINLYKYKDQISIYIFPTGMPHDSYIANFILRVGTWSVIFTKFVPISLLVSLETIKYIQGMFISWDLNIYQQETKTPAKVQTSTLNEELGQVKYIFSDKTGTLTKNYMEFKKMSIGKYSYGVDKSKNYLRHFIIYSTNIRFK